MPIKDIAQQTIGRILGDAAFIFTDVLDEKAKPSAADWDAEGVSLTFTGRPSGELRMWVGSGFARVAAANMLGIDTESGEARQKGIDALKELLNMVVGNFITAAYGDTPVFDVGLPRTLPRERLAQDFSHPDAIWLEAEGNPVLFVVQVNQN
jgi:hypothetical protein